MNLTKMHRRITNFKIYYVYLMQCSFFNNKTIHVVEEQIYYYGLTLSWCVQCPKYVVEEHNYMNQRRIAWASIYVLHQRLSEIYVVLWYRMQLCGVNWQIFVSYAHANYRKDRQQFLFFGCKYLSRCYILWIKRNNAV